MLADFTVRFDYTISLYETPVVIFKKILDKLQIIYYNKFVPFEGHGRGVIAQLVRVPR